MVVAIFKDAFVADCDKGVVGAGVVALPPLQPRGRGPGSRLVLRFIKFT